MKLPRLNQLIALAAVAALVAGSHLLRAADPASPPTKPAAERFIYTCPMHPRVQSAKPGACPACHMALVAKKVAAASTPGTASPLMAADGMTAAGEPAPDHASMKMDAAGTPSNGMNMPGMKGAGMGNCPMGGCAMGVGNMSAAAPAPAGGKVVPAMPMVGFGGGCGCR